MQTQTTWILVQTIIMILIGIVPLVIEKICTKPHRVLTPLEEWRFSNMVIRMLLHRICALITLGIVITFVCINSADVWPLNIMLMVMVVLEVYWSIYYLRKNNERIPLRFLPGIANKTWFIERIRLRHVRTRYPNMPLLIEATVVTALCIATGGSSSPFIFLLAFYACLTVYIIYDARLSLSFVYIAGLSTCFLLISFLPFLPQYFLEVGLTNKILASMSIVKNPGLAAFIFFYSLTMAAIVSYFLIRTSEVIVKWFLELAVERTKWILESNPSIKLYKLPKNSPVFIIGPNRKIKLESTLALIPYCLRHKECPQRKKADGVNICRQCSLPCQVKVLFKHETNNIPIGHVAIISTSHDIEGVSKDFETNNGDFTHLIAICCTSNFAKYLPEFLHHHPNITIIFSPLLAGDWMCHSSVDPGYEGSPIGPEPTTYCDVAGLCEYLNQHCA